MARSKSAVPSYCLHKASGRAVCRVAGRDHYLGVYGSPESRRAYAELLASLDSGNLTSLDSGNLTVAGLAARYDRHARSYYVKAGRPTRQYERVRRSMGLVVELHAATRAADFGPLALSAVRERMVALGWSRKHVNSCVGCVKRAWRWAASVQLVPPASYDALRTLDGLRQGRTKARETPPVGPVDDATVEATLPYLRPETADMVRLQRLTAMRAGEVCALRAEEIDRTGAVWAWRPADHKTAHAGKGRVILFGPKAQALLTPHLESEGRRESVGFVFSPRRAAAHAPPAGAKRPPGEKYTSNSYQRAIRKACSRAGVTPWHSHQLRHGAATELRREFGLEVAQIVLGHSRADVTQVYAEVNLAKAVDAMRRAG